MSAIREEIINYINDISDEKLEALRPILSILVDDGIAIETNLTDEEKEIIRQGREEYKKGGFVRLEDIK